MSSNPFGPIDIARTGLGFSKFWTETVAHNIANVNTFTRPGEEPFRARMVDALPLDPTQFATGGGVAVRDVLDQEGDPALVYDPASPLADDEGYVQAAVVDLSGQLTDMILASRTYQANLTVLNDSRQMLEATTQMGRG